MKDTKLPDAGYHRMTVRMDARLHAYLEHLSYKTRLDISQIIRLLIWLAPENKEFNEIINQYTRADRRGVFYVADFRDKDYLWKRA